MRNVGCEKPCHQRGQLGIEGGFLSAAHHCRVMGLPNKQVNRPSQEAKSNDQVKQSIRSNKAQEPGLGSQAFTAFGAACIDHSTATACFHANQKSVCACAACLRGLISAFHFESDIFGGNRRLSQTFWGLANPASDLS